MIGMGNRLEIAFASLALLSLTACVRTESYRTSYAKASGTPYHKILVCCPSASRTAGAEMEALMSDRLHRHKIEATTCTDLLYPLRESPINSTAEDIRKWQFDAVLVLQREPVSAEVHQPPGPMDRAYKNLEGFIADYDAKVLAQTPAQALKVQAQTEESVYILFGRDRFIHARADLLGIRENQVVWSTSGVAEGSVKAPVTKFMASFAKDIDQQLTDLRFFVKRW